MARRLSLLLRMLLSLALIVAAMPLRAGAPPCASRPVPRPAPVAKGAAHGPRCAMPCCAKRAVEMACCKPAQASSASSSLGEGCRCELKASPAVPAVETKAILPSFGGLLWAPSGEAPFVAPAAVLGVEPGIVGTDSGPPKPPPTASDASRAPPVVRV